MADKQLHLLLSCIVAITHTTAISPQVLESYYSHTSPKIDGYINKEEWKSATHFVGVQHWIHRMNAAPAPTPSDLAMEGWVMHDKTHLYFAFNVTDDVLFGIDIPRWLPAVNPSADNLTRKGYPWFGDEMELLLTARQGWQNEKDLNGSVGNASSWQMVLNFGKSRLHGMGVGGLLEGEPRSSLNAWNTYQHWILSGMQVGASHPRLKASAGHRGYEAEWAVSFECLEITPGVYYNTSMEETDIGMNIALGDVDSMQAGDGNFANIHHEEWLAGLPKNKCPGKHDYLNGSCLVTSIRNFGTLRMMSVNTTRN
eukprot:m.4423 g.4423  ORF g.4423 m.4423 type:complete len:312 (+) comp2979_c0_seq2:89-1024(+)